MSSEIHNLYKDLNIVDDVKIRKLEEGGHIIRMGDEGWPITFLNGKHHNKRQMGKPRTRWEDVIRRDTSQTLGKRGLGRRAEEREELR
jgi:hypothetical protein